MTFNKVNGQTYVGFKSTGWISTNRWEELHKNNIATFVFLAEEECKWSIKTVLKDIISCKNMGMLKKAKNSFLQI